VTRTPLLLAVVGMLLAVAFFSAGVPYPPSTTTAHPSAGSTLTPAETSGSLSCPTPTNPGNWASANFFSDVDVSFTVPNAPSLSGAAFQTVPCTNSIPTYTEGVWLNISTDVPISQATVTMWATGWPTASNPTPPVAGFSPTSVARFAMYVPPTQPTSASFFINCYHYFWPGSQVFLNLTVNSTVGVPNSLNSAQRPYTEAEDYNGIVNNATWQFEVAPEWPTASFGDDVAVTTTPSALGNGSVFDPNDRQALDVTLSSLAPEGGIAPPIGSAELFFNLTGSNAGGPFNEYFSPANRTVVNLSTPLGPYPNGSVHFQILAWTLWSGGIVDPIESPVYTVNWTSHGGWWDPSLGVAGNLELSASPDVLTGNATLATATPVNVTIHSPLPNVTIGSAAIAFRYQDSVGFYQGLLPMRAMSANTSYAVVPGLPPGGDLTFSVVAKDIYGTAVASGNYTYSETGAVTTSPLPGYGLVYIEAVDVSTGELVPSVAFSIQNGSWQESARGTPLGFATVVSPGGGSAPFPLAYGAYSVEVRAFDDTPSGVVVVASPEPTLLVFDVASSGIPPDVYSAVPALQWGAIGGLVAVALAAPMLVRWFRERRSKVEAEQRRVTLG
jgi:hypothetical protein